jgi:outer membrane protein assembly factor BamA
MRTIGMNLRIAACFSLFVLSAHTNNLFAQSSVHVRIETSGSTPPLGSLFDCATSLKAKPYSPVTARGCLNHLLATGYFERGQFRTEKIQDEVTLIFDLKSPGLIVSTFSLELSDPDKSNLEVSLDNTPGVLSQGKVYSQEAELTTARQITKFFFQQGRRVGLHSKISLDFTTRTATVNYSIVEGPPGPGPGDLEAYSFDKECKEMVAVVDFRGSDDYVPLILVQRLMKTHFGSCYDEASVQADAENLRKTALFAEVNFSLEGEQDRRTLSVAISGKPLKVRSVSVRCYGPPARDCQAIAGQLPLTTGAVYSRSNDWLARKQVEKLLSRPHQNQWVFEDLTAQDNSGIAIVYGVILERTELSINGKNIPNYDGTDISSVINSP